MKKDPSKYGLSSKSDVRKAIRKVKDNEFRDGKTALGKIVNSYVLPAVAIGGVAAGVGAVTGVTSKILGGAIKKIEEKAIEPIAPKISEMKISKPSSVSLSKTFEAKSLLGSTASKGGIDSVIDKVTGSIEKAQGLFGGIKSKIDEVKQVFTGEGQSIKQVQANQRSSLLPWAAGFGLLMLLKNG